jgi:hypothetical protein
MNSNAQRIVLSLVFLAGLVASLAFLQSGPDYISGMLQGAFFAIILLDWIWIRIVRPALEAEPRAIAPGAR